MWAANVVHVRAPIGATRGDKHRLVRRSVRGSLVVEPLGLRTQKTGWAGARCACACVCVRVRVAYASLCGACGTRWLGYGVVGVRALDAVEGETSKASRQGPPPQEKETCHEPWRIQASGREGNRSKLPPDHPRVRRRSNRSSHIR